MLGGMPDGEVEFTSKEERAGKYLGPGFFANQKLDAVVGEGEDTQYIEVKTGYPGHKLHELWHAKFGDWPDPPQGRFVMVVARFGLNPSIESTADIGPRGRDLAGAVKLLARTNWTEGDDNFLRSELKRSFDAVMRMPGINDPFEDGLVTMHETLEETPLRIARQCDQLLKEDDEEIVRVAQVFKEAILKKGASELRKASPARVDYVERAKEELRDRKEGQQTSTEPLKNPFLSMLPFFDPSMMEEYVAVPISKRNWFHNKLDTAAWRERPSNEPIASNCEVGTKEDHLRHQYNTIIVEPEVDKETWAKMTGIGAKKIESERMAENGERARGLDQIPRDIFEPGPELLGQIQNMDVQFKHTCGDFARMLEERVIDNHRELLEIERITEDMLEDNEFERTIKDQAAERLNTRLGQAMMFTSGAYFGLVSDHGKIISRDKSTSNKNRFTTEVFQGKLRVTVRRVGPSSPCMRVMFTWKGEAQMSPFMAPGKPLGGGYYTTSMLTVDKERAYILSKAYGKYMLLLAQMLENQSLAMKNPTTEDLAQAMTLPTIQLLLDYSSTTQTSEMGKLGPLIFGKKAAVAASVGEEYGDTCRALVAELPLVRRPLEVWLARKMLKVVTDPEEDGRVLLGGTKVSSWALREVFRVLESGLLRSKTVMNSELVWDKNFKPLKQGVVAYDTDGTPLDRVLPEERREWARRVSQENLDMHDRANGESSQFYTPGYEQWRHCKFYPQVPEYQALAAMGFIGIGGTRDIAEKVAALRSSNRDDLCAWFNQDPWVLVNKAANRYKVGAMQDGTDALRAYCVKHGISYSSVDPVFNDPKGADIKLIIAHHPPVRALLGAIGASKVKLKMLIDILSQKPKSPLASAKSVMELILICCAEVKKSNKMGQFIKPQVGTPREIYLGGIYYCVIQTFLEGLGLKINAKSTCDTLSLPVDYIYQREAMSMKMKAHREANDRAHKLVFLSSATDFTGYHQNVVPKALGMALLAFPDGKKECCREIIARCVCVMGVKEVYFDDLRSQVLRKQFRHIKATKKLQQADRFIRREHTKPIRGSADYEARLRIFNRVVPGEAKLVLKVMGQGNQSATMAMWMGHVYHGIERLTQMDIDGLVKDGVLLAGSARDLDASDDGAQLNCFAIPVKAKEDGSDSVEIGEAAAKLASCHHFALMTGVQYASGGQPNTKKAVPPSRYGTYNSEIYLNGRLMPCVARAAATFGDLDPTGAGLTQNQKILNDGIKLQRTGIAQMVVISGMVAQRQMFHRVQFGTMHNPKNAGMWYGNILRRIKLGIGPTPAEFVMFNAFGCIMSLPAMMAALISSSHALSDSTLDQLAKALSCVKRSRSMEYDNNSVKIKVVMHAKKQVSTRELHEEGWENLSRFGITEDVLEAYDRDPSESWQRLATNMMTLDDVLHCTGSFAVVASKIVGEDYYQSRQYLKPSDLAIVTKSMMWSMAMMTFSMVAEEGKFSRGRWNLWKMQMEMDRMKTENTVFDFMFHFPGDVERIQDIRSMKRTAVEFKETQRWRFVQETARQEGLSDAGLIVAQYFETDSAGHSLKQVHREWPYRYEECLLRMEVIRKHIPRLALILPEHLEAEGATEHCKAKMREHNVMMPEIVADVELLRSSISRRKYATGAGESANPLEVWSRKFSKNFQVVEEADLPDEVPEEMSEKEKRERWLSAILQYPFLNSSRKILMMIGKTEKTSCFKPNLRTSLLFLEKLAVCSWYGQSGASHEHYKKAVLGDLKEMPKDERIDRLISTTFGLDVQERVQVIHELTKIALHGIQDDSRLRVTKFPWSELSGGVADNETASMKIVLWESSPALTSMMWTIRKGKSLIVEDRGVIGGPVKNKGYAGKMQDRLAELGCTGMRPIHTQYGQKMQMLVRFMVGDSQATVVVWEGKVSSTGRVTGHEGMSLDLKEFCETRKILPANKDSNTLCRNLSRAAAVIREPSGHSVPLDLAASSQVRVGLTLTDRLSYKGRCTIIATREIAWAVKRAKGVEDKDLTPDTDDESEEGDWEEEEEIDPKKRAAILSILMQDAKTLGDIEGIDPGELVQPRTKAPAWTEGAESYLASFNIEQMRSAAMTSRDSLIQPTYNGAKAAATSFAFANKTCYFMMKVRMPDVVVTTARVTRQPGEEERENVLDALLAGGMSKDLWSFS